MGGRNSDGGDREQARSLTTIELVSSPNWISSTSSLIQHFDDIRGVVLSDPLREECLSSFLRAPSPVRDRRAPRSPASWNAKSAPISNAACWPMDSSASAATPVATTGSWPSRVKPADSVLPVAVAAWPTPRPSSSTGCYPRSRSDSGCSRCPIRFDTAAPGTRGSRARSCAPSCDPSSQTIGAEHESSSAFARGSAARSRSSNASGRP